MDELKTATEEYEYLMGLYKEEAKAAFEHRTNVEVLRALVMTALDNKRALERELLSKPIVPMFAKPKTINDLIAL